MANPENRRIVLAARPDGRPKPSDFRIERTPIPEPKDGEILLETLYLSLDPYMRWRMNAAKSYAQATEIGEVMVGATVARVARSRHPEWRDGDVVLAASGWQGFAVSDGTGL
ncbi:MAG: NADP-dependent oxidoreductase, partial [Gemmatimonadaceae bacterium]|nr:NADP-dependent oxidoreductase [Acetobacteraceae bacterium]